jgi:hypothetical protein
MRRERAIKYAEHEKDEIEAEEVEMGDFSGAVVTRRHYWGGSSVSGIVYTRTIADYNIPSWWRSHEQEYARGKYVEKCRKAVEDALRLATIREMAEEC